MRRIVVIAAGMDGIRAATRIKRRLFAHEINVVVPNTLTEPPAVEGPAGRRRAGGLPNLEILATREVGVLEAQDIMPDLEARELTVTSSRGSITIRYSDLVIEVPATVRLPRALQRCRNVFPWPMPGFADDPAPCDTALSAAASSDEPVLVVGGGMAALDAVLLAVQAGAAVHWLRTAEKDSPAIDPHLAALAVKRLAASVSCTLLPECPAERLLLSLSADGARLERLAPPPNSDGCDASAIPPVGSCCLWTTPLMARHPLLREEGVFLDAGGRIVTGEELAERLSLRLMGSGAAVPAAVLSPSGAAMPAFPGGEESAALSAWLAVDSVCGLNAAEASGSGNTPGILGARRAAMPGLTLCRAGLTLAEAEQQGLEAETAVIAMETADEDARADDGNPLVLSLVCDKASRTVIGAQVLGMGEADREADGLFGMALAALAEGTPLSALARRAQAGLPGRLLAEAAAIALNKLDTVINGISPDEFLASRAAGAEFFTLDLRSMPDWRAGHVPGAYNIPLTQLKKRLEDEVPRFTPLVLVSADGRDAYAVARRLAGLGAASLYVLDGGMRLWPHALETQ